MSSCPDYLINSELVLFSSFFVLNMYDTFYSTVCLCYFSLQWKRTYSSTNQSLHIRVTINCFCLIIQIVLIFAFVLFCFSSKRRTQKVSFPLVFPQMFGLWFSFCFCSWQFCSCFFCIFFLWLNLFAVIFRFLVLVLVAYFVCCILKKFHIYNSLSNICLEKTNWWKNERLHFDLACNLLI